MKHGTAFALLSLLILTACGGGYQYHARTAGEVPATITEAAVINGITERVSIKKINEVAVSHDWIGTKRGFELSPGVNRVTFSYDCNYPNTYFRGQDMVFVFNAQPGVAYAIEAAKDSTGIRSGQTITISLKDSAGQVLDARRITLGQASLGGPF